MITIPDYVFIFLCNALAGAIIIIVALIILLMKIDRMRDSPTN